MEVLTEQCGELKTAEKPFLIYMRILIMTYLRYVIITILMSSCTALAGNETINSFEKSKDYLRRIYADHRENYAGSSIGILLGS